MPAQSQTRQYSAKYTPLNDLYDEKTNNLPIDQDLQQIMNTPPLDPDELNVTDKQYLEIIIKMIESGKINLLNPRTLLNEKVYDQLKGEKEKKVDINTNILMARLRDIYELWKLKKITTYQMKLLIQELRQIEARVEQECGNVYVI